MTAPTERRPLLILSPTLGGTSETFIERHCRELAPGATCFATFAIEKSSDAWPPTATSVLAELPKPAPSVGARLADRLRPRRRRHAHRGVWWVSDEAANEILDHAKRNEVTCALVQYLDRWLNVIPRLADAGVRVVVHGHGYDLSSSLRNPATVDAYRAFLPSADCLVVPSRHAAQRLADHGHQNVTVVPYGIPVGPRPPPRSAVGPVKLLAVGRLVAKKDPVGLVEAVARARALGADLHLDLIGDGPLAPHVARAIRAHSLTNVVSTLGAVPYDAVLEAMSSADIFVQRSRTAIGGDEEGLPLSILEAMASQLPVVSTAHAGIPEAVEDGSTGLLHAEDDASGFAASIVRYCDEPDLRRAHGEAGRARVEAMFSWDRERVELRNLLGLSTATEL